MSLVIGIILIFVAVVGIIIALANWPEKFVHGQPQSSPFIQSVVPKSVNTISLTWTFTATNPGLGPPVRFEIERIDPQFAATIMDKLAHPSPLSFDDTGLLPNTKYRYRVRAIFGTGGSSPWSDSMEATTLAFTPTFQATLDQDDNGWEGRTLVQRIEASQLQRSGTQVRLTLRASSTSDVSIDRIFISQPDPAGNDPYDSAADLKMFYDKVIVPANTSLTLSDTLPDVQYNLDEGQPLLIAVDFSSGAPSGLRFRDNVPRNQGIAYWEHGTEAQIRDRRDDYNSEDRIYLIERIDVG
jgi:hypothetical protein